MSTCNLNQDESLPLNDELIVSYLEDNPDFFNRQSQLLSRLTIKDNHRGTISLVERQQQIVRQKVHALEEEITQLITVANHNEKLFSVYSDIYLKLIDCNSADELLDCLLETTTKLLSLADLKLWLNVANTCEHQAIVNNDCSEILASRLSKADYYFGRLQQSEQSLIFSHQHAGSVVLIKLEYHAQLLGFLAISSNDAEHFDPRMDTLLLSQFQKLIAKLIYKQLG